MTCRRALLVNWQMSDPCAILLLHATSANTNSGIVGRSYAQILPFNAYTYAEESHRAYQLKFFALLDEHWLAHWHLARRESAHITKRPESILIWSLLDTSEQIPPFLQGDFGFT